MQKICLYHNLTSGGSKRELFEFTKRFKRENYTIHLYCQIEEKETLKFLKSKKTVISLGGGAFLNDKIKKEILNNHISFWLSWNVKTLIDRIENSKKRPIAYKLTRSEIEELIKKRSIIYSKAMYKIDCENQTNDESS